jgi:NitT/TauT family transport system substrate-binding protein
LLWTHTNTFAGYYAADRKGYYAAEGLSVKLIPGGPRVDYLTPVVEGAAQFGDGGADEMLVARSEGKPLRAIATTYRRSPVVFFARAASGITRPEEFAGKTIRLAPGLGPTLHAMMARVGISRDRYRVVVAPSDAQQFASGQIPVWGAYVNAFVTELERAGHALNLIYPDNYGVHFYGNCIFAREDLLTAKPELARRFLRATLRGWAAVVEDPGIVGNLVAAYTPDTDIALENARMVASLPLVNTGEDRLGWMRPEVWAGMERMLRAQGVVTKPLDVSRSYTRRFLEEIYGAP